MFFCPNPFQWLWSCSFRYATITPPRISYPKQECRRSLAHYIPQVPFRLLVQPPHLPFPAKKLHYTAKKSRQPCRKRLPPAAFHYVPRHLLAAPSLHSRTARASPYTSKKSLHYVPLIFVQTREISNLFEHFRVQPKITVCNFLLVPVGSRLLYLLCFPLRPRTAPDHPPLKDS